MGNTHRKRHAAFPGEAAVAGRIKGGKKWRWLDEPAQFRGSGWTLAEAQARAEKALSDRPGFEFRVVRRGEALNRRENIADSLEPLRKMAGRVLFWCDKDDEEEHFFMPIPDTAKKSVTLVWLRRRDGTFGYRGSASRLTPRNQDMPWQMATALDDEAAAAQARAAVRDHGFAAPEPKPLSPEDEAEWSMLGESTTCRAVFSADGRRLLRMRPVQRQHLFLNADVRQDWHPEWIQSEKSAHDGRLHLCPMYRSARA